jgi:hypothetical protein
MKETNPGRDREERMMDSNYYETKESTLSDRAIDGLFSGLFAGAVMGLLMAMAGFLIGENPGSVFARFNLGPSPSHANGVLMHLGISGVYGVLFALLSMVIPGRVRKLMPGWLVGLVYASILLALALYLFVPGLLLSLADLPEWVLISGHAAYGIVLGVKAFPRAG